ncbi:sodium:solute symporter [Frigidibacter albus]|uniref:histidine kinase n=1 Tax=Frigidibacter albus TaxID=1465486 RepID=A0A6L8VCR0_9RHOB|nr:ATP-binding protein [Frigidibacter albus]MZQ88105.1 sodium:solute symporter [Frigidibacter albus]NBE30221.1 sodium:solute symporter [Frigidibacter albus]
MPFNLLVASCLLYVILLFLVAFWAERQAQRGRVKWLRSPLVYTLSLSIYCTAWTFYGAVGYAARSGLEFVTIYLGPTLVLIGWWWVLRKLVRIGRTQRVTSIADLISSRFGKSNLLGVIVTLICVVAATPYIALQLQSVTLSFNVFAGPVPEGWAMRDSNSTAFWVAAGLTLFTILFGTRNLDANERHNGVVTAIALEAVVKLVALLAVGVFTVWIVASGPADILSRIEASEISDWQMQPGRWAGLTFLAGAAILTLPRMFQVMVVENADERHMATASWAFPLYLFAMSLFVVPIAVVGLAVLPEGSNPDLFVLTLPLAFDQGGLAMLAFLGGFSSATSMVIVEAIALATMVSNHIVMPLWLRFRTGGARGAGDVRGLVLNARRLSIAGVLALGYGYFALSGGSSALAAIGLISFVGVAQILPAMLGGLFWRGATRVGAAAGLLTGFAIWLYVLFLPSFGAGELFGAELMLQGPLGIGWLRPQALFGITGIDPLLHALFWSLSLNTALFCGVSLLTFPGPMERLQGVAFVNVFDHSGPTRGWSRGGAEAEDLLAMAQGILGADEAQGFFQAQAAAQGKAGFLPDTTPEFFAALERRLAGSVGAATAHAMIAQFAAGAAVSVQDLMAVANEAQQIMEYSSQLEAKSEELARTARALSEANEKLQALSVQKDAFLSQISHELRTPMTSIRAFSEILMEGGLEGPDQARYAEIIHDETIRLTRLLDDLLDLSVLENGRVQLNVQVANLHDLIDRALQAAGQTRVERRFVIHRDLPAEHMPIFTDTDRLVQVFINLISNARKYCDAARPELTIKVRRRGGQIEVDFIDNGSGIPAGSQSLVFEKFARLTDTTRAGGAGLGLAICREIMANLGGTITYVPGQGGAAFRVALPARRQREAA